jgi:excisionase family DNA binding protein
MLVQLTEVELATLVEGAVARALEAERAPLPEHLTAREAATLLRCSDRKVRRLIATGLLPKAKLANGGSSRVLIPRAALESFIADAMH